MAQLSEGPHDLGGCSPEANQLRYEDSDAMKSAYVDHDAGMCSRSGETAILWDGLDSDKV